MRITLGKVLEKKAMFKEYMKNCYENNKGEKCFRQLNGHGLCKSCPKGG